MQVSEVVRNAYEKALEVRENAHAPYSKFKVGVGLKLKDYQDIFVGCNVENASFGATVCAERNAIFNSVAKYGKQKLDFVVVVTHLEQPAVPCALCLQVMAEFNDPEIDIYLANTSQIVSTHKMKDFLPKPFSDFDV